MKPRMTSDSFRRALPVLASLLLAFNGTIRAQESASLPHLALNHGVTQIIVNGKPFLVRGGELENSSASSLSYMETAWPKIVAMHCNTVLAPAYWRLIEPQEDKFYFTTVDGIIRGARQHHVRLVLLWFGSWKNSMSSYVPDWVKNNQQRFPRAVRTDGTSIEILSALSKNNLAADSSAFVALMRHLREIDGTEHTVILIQVENEVGMIPDARDHSAAANAAFLSPVPAALTSYLSKNIDSLQPALKQEWEAHGMKVGANWPDTFGIGPATDELFTA
jgi:beta-galactosidase GanA